MRKERRGIGKNSDSDLLSPKEVITQNITQITIEGRDGNGGMMKTNEKTKER